MIFQNFVITSYNNLALEMMIMCKEMSNESIMSGSERFTRGIKLGYVEFLYSFGNVHFVGKDI